MPADHGLGVTTTRVCFQAEQNPRERPKEFVQRTELGPGMSAFQYGEMLAKRQILQQKALR